MDWDREEQQQIETELFFCRMFIFNFQEWHTTSPGNMIIDSTMRALIQKWEYKGMQFDISHEMRDG